MQTTNVIGLQTVAAVCRAAGVTRNFYDRSVNRQLIATPTHELPGGGRRLHYTAAEAKKVIAELVKLSKA